MRVNSAFRGVGIAMRCSLVIVMVFCFGAVSGFGTGKCDKRGIGSGIKTTVGLARTAKGESPFGRDRESRVKQVNLLVRLIGHRLLIQAGDFTSRVLPVTEVREGTFALNFENQVRFSHDSLISLANDLFSKSEFPSGYTVMVLDCMNAAIVYGFQINHATPDLVACQGRFEPAGCYTIEFTFPDFYRLPDEEPEVQKTAEHASSGKEHHVPESKHQAKIVSATTDIDKLVAELKTFKAESKVLGIRNKQVERSPSYGSLLTLIPSGLLLVLGVSLLIGRFGKGVKQRQSQIENVNVEDAAVTLPSLGKFLFDSKAQRLLLGDEVISLTDKECRVLQLLHEQFGQLIPRDTLMQRIWIDEGVITGRSLDMFVSKLRKKLSADPELRITNVHAKGYRLERTSW